MLAWDDPMSRAWLGTRDLVHLRKEPMALTTWPLARMIEVHPGQDENVRVIIVEKK